MLKLTRGPGSFLSLLGAAALCLMSACHTPGQAVVKTELQKGQPGYQLALQAIGCWFGGQWDEAEGRPAPEWRAVTDRRCREVLDQVHGSEQHYSALRAVEPQEIEDVAQKAGADAGADREGVVGLLRAVGAAQRETWLARQAANKVRKDLRSQAEATQLSQDEVDAVAPLTGHEALMRLTQVDLGPFSGDAHMLGLLSAMDRMRIVRGLPKHLKVYAMEGVGQVVFAVAPPDVPSDATKPLTPGVWLSYLVDIARAAGHPVPDSVSMPADRELLAWSGVLKGLGEKLRMEEPHLSNDAGPTLRPIVDTVIQKMDSEYEAARRTAKVPGG